jgi:hypothetical protein
MGMSDHYWRRVLTWFREHHRFCVFWRSHPKDPPRLSLFNDDCAWLVQDILRKDLAVDMYFVTGKLTKEVFDDNCRCGQEREQIAGQRLQPYLAKDARQR